MVDIIPIEVPIRPNCFPMCQIDGMIGELCKSFILEEAPDLSIVQVLPEFFIVTTYYQLERVRIFVSNLGIVIGNPFRG